MNCRELPLPGANHTSKSSTDNGVAVLRLSGRIHDTPFFKHHENTPWEIPPKKTPVISRLGWELSTTRHVKGQWLTIPTVERIHLPQCRTGHRCCFTGKAVGVEQPEGENELKGPVEHFVKECKDILPPILSVKPGEQTAFHENKPGAQSNWLWMARSTSGPASVRSSLPASLSPPGA